MHPVCGFKDVLHLGYHQWLAWEKDGRELDPWCRGSGCEVIIEREKILEISLLLYFVGVSNHPDNLSVPHVCSIPCKGPGLQSLIHIKWCLSVVRIAQSPGYEMQLLTHILRGVASRSSTSSLNSIVYGACAHGAFCGCVLIVQFVSFIMSTQTTVLFWCFVCFLQCVHIWAGKKKFIYYLPKKRKEGDNL